MCALYSRFGNVCHTSDRQASPPDFLSELSCVEGGGGEGSVAKILMGIISYLIELNIYAPIAPLVYIQYLGINPIEIRIYMIIKK
jgi:hypothetical protein